MVRFLWSTMIFIRLKIEYLHEIDECVGGSVFLGHTCPKIYVLKARKKSVYFVEFPRDICKSELHTGLVISFYGPVSTIAFVLVIIICAPAMWVCIT